MYTKQKAIINDKLSTNMMNTLSASRQTAENQAKYNDQMDNIYYNYYEEKAKSQGDAEKKAIMEYLGSTAKN